MSLYNLVKVSTTTIGTGAINLGSAVSGFLSFADAGVADGAPVVYSIREGSNSEVGRGHYTSAGATLSRDTIYSSTNSGSEIILAGSAEVVITAAAENFATKSIDDFAGTTFTEKMNAAIAAINAGSGVHVHIPGSASSYVITSQLDAITGNNWSITGDGPNTRLQLDSSIGTTGNFFRFGDGSTTSSRGKITGFYLNCANTPTANEFAFDYINCQYIDVEECFVANIAGLSRFGNGVTDAVRCNLHDIWGNNNNGTTTPAILLQSYSMCRIDRITLTETVSGATRTGASLKMHAPSGATDFGDTTYITAVSLLSWNETDANYRPYAVEIDISEGKQVNVWIDKMVGDHTGTAAVYVHGTGANDVTCLKITNSRFVTDAGKGVHFDYDGSAVCRNVLIQSNLIHIEDGDEHFRIEGVGDYSGCYFIDNDLSEAGSAPARVRSILVANGSGWTIDRNKLSNRSGVGTTSGTVRGIVITDTALDHCAITDNDFSIVTNEAVSLPTFGLTSSTRYIAFNLGPNGQEHASTVMSHDHESHDWAAYGETIAWTAGSSPSGASNIEYSWNRVGKNVNVRVRGEWASPGTTVTIADLPFPSDLPTPSYPTSSNEANSIFGAGNGCILAGETTALSTQARAWFRVISAAPHMRIVDSSKSADLIFFEGSYTAA